MPITAGMVGAPIVGGLLGNIFGGGEKDQAQQAQQQALQQILAVKDPQLQQIMLQQYRQAGVITPEMEQVISQGPSAMQGISTDPGLKQAQMNALSSLQQQGRTGLSASDVDALNRIQQQSAQQNRAQQASILQEQQQRGIGGSGNELAARLIGAQGGAQNAMNQGNAVAAQAQQNALNAIAQSGQLGGQIRGQDFGEQSAKAQAADAIARFNAQNSQGVNTRNTGAANQAQYSNLANLQNIYNQNTGLGNQQEMFNKYTLPTAQYGMDMSKASAAANALNSNAAQHNQNAANTGQMWAGIGQGVGGALGGIQQQNNNNNWLNAYKASNPAKNKGMSDEDASDLAQYE